MAITFTLNDEAVNDQTSGLQIGDSDDGFTDTDVAYSSLPAAFRTFLETTLGLSSTFPTNVGVATKTNSVTVNASGQISGINFTDGNGGALDGDDSGLDTVDGKDILLFAAVGNDDIVIGRYDSDGDNVVDATAFVIFKEEVFNAGATSAQVTFHIVTYTPIFHDDVTDPDDAVDLGNNLKLAASEAIVFSFAGAPSGANLFMTFGDPASAQIVVTGQDPLNQSQGGNINTKDVLNISQAQGNTSFGVNGNQINPDEGAFITYVTGANTNFLVPNLSQNEADIEANIAFQNVFNATSASFTVNQTNPPTGPVTVQITAFTTAAESGVNYVDGLTNDTLVPILSAEVVNNDGGETPVVSISGGVLTVSGLSSEDVVRWTTSGDHNRVLIENISDDDGIAGNDNNTFDIGGFSLISAAAASAFVGQQIVIEDDGPAASGATESALVQEDDLSTLAGDLSDGIDEAGDPPTDEASGTLTALVTAGTDAPATFTLSAVTSGLPSLTSKGDAVTYSVTDGATEDTLTATAGGRTVFTLVVAANGAYTFDLKDQLDHADGGDAATLAIDLSSVIVATDADGDSVTPPANAFVINVENDVPVASGATESATVQEDDLSTLAGDLSDGIDEAGDPPTDEASGTLTALVTPGADEPATFSLSAVTSGLPSLTSKGDAVTYSVTDGATEDTLTATAGGRTVFTLVVAANGAYTFDLKDQLDHADGGDAAILAIDLSSVIVATDFDGDSVTPPANAFVINVENDVPTIGPIADGLVDFAAGDSVTNPLNGTVGADEPATFSVTSSPETVTIFDGTSAELTLLRDISPDATVVTYFNDVDGSGTRTAGDTDFFQLTLSGGNYKFDVLEDPPAAELQFSFAGAPSGANLFMTFGDPNSAQIVVIGQDPLNQSQGGNINTKDVLNISQAQGNTSFGVNGNQINPDEGAFITYVTGANTNFLVPNLSQNEADIEANIAFQNVFDATAASFTVNQTNPPTGPVTVQITAFTTAAESGVNYVDGLTNDTLVPILSAEVVNNDGGETPVVSISGGVLTVSGLSSEDVVRWTTSGDHNRVLIENISDDDGIAGNDNNTFDIGGFSLFQALATPDEKLDFTVQIADFDGDTANDPTAPFSIGIDGTGVNDDDQVDGIVV